ncbi:MAG TPA: hypothetical protein DCY07_05375 [Rhodospirillaceae bacterium]|nr:hypothetical protein [Rhodospirillaceae bacterium]
MNEKVADQLDKVLALADSDQEGEALGALRMARRMLSRDGLTFSDLAQVAKRSSFSLSRKIFSPSTVQLEARIDQMHDELHAHVIQNQSLTEQIEVWRRRAFELEQLLSMNQAEAARWKEMARETAERLWDLGQMARADAFLSPDPLPEDDVVDEPLKAAG